MRAETLTPNSARKIPPAPGSFAFAATSPIRAFMKFLWAQLLRELIELAGGVAGSGKLQAVLLGGAAGAFVTPQELDTPLTFEGTRAIGATLGSGVVMLFDDTMDLRRILLRIASFFRHETCGQCVPCRIGSARQEEALQRLVNANPLGSNARKLRCYGRWRKPCATLQFAVWARPPPARWNRPCSDGVFFHE